MHLIGKGNQHHGVFESVHMILISIGSRLVTSDNMDLRFCGQGKHPFEPGHMIFTGNGSQRHGYQ